MQHRDNMTTAMNAFLRQLPDPKLSNTPTISAHFKVKGKEVEFVAQTVKGVKGLTWKVYPKTENTSETR